MNCKRMKFKREKKNAAIGSLKLAISRMKFPKEFPFSIRWKKNMHYLHFLSSLLWGFFFVNGNPIRILFTPLFLAAHSKPTPSWVQTKAVYTQRGGERERVAMHPFLVRFKESAWRTLGGEYQSENKYMKKEKNYFLCAFSTFVKHTLTHVCTPLWIAVHSIKRNSISVRNLILALSDFERENSGEQDVNEGDAADGDAWSERRKKKHTLTQYFNK